VYVTENLEDQDVWVALVEDAEKMREKMAMIEQALTCQKWLKH
jgi:hypothetical protein